MKKIFTLFSAVVLMPFAAGLAQAGDFAAPAQAYQKISVPSASEAETVDTVSSSSSKKPAEWLFLVYLSGFNNLSLAGKNNFASSSVNQMESVGSSDNLKILVEYASVGADGNSVNADGTVNTLYIKQDADARKINSEIVFNPSRGNMGDPETLVTFVKKALSDQRFSARKIALVIWSHGFGFDGISLDEVNDSYISLRGLAKALKEINGALGGRNIDVLAMDACNMQMASVINEIKDYSRYIVASQEAIPGCGFPYGPILSGIQGKSGAGLSKYMVSEYSKFYQNSQVRNACGVMAPVTLSAVNSSAVSGMTKGFDAWLQTVSRDPEAKKAAVKPFDGIFVPNGNTAKDMLVYINKVAKAAGTKASGDAVRRVTDQLTNYISGRVVVGNTALDSMGEVMPAYGASSSAPAQGESDRRIFNGLAVFIPEDYDADTATYYSLSFARTTQWANFVNNIKSNLE